jgi:gamma-glutamylputrescine oxidase
VVEADACVIGIGGSGLAAIDEFLSAGLSVAGLDAATVGGGAAGRNGGLLRAGTSRAYHDAVRQYGARASRWYSATVNERERLLQRFPTIARRSGHLRLASDAAEERDCREQMKAMAADGWPVAWYDGPLGAGLLVAGDGAIDPLARCRAEAEAARAHGARLFEHSPVERIARGVVETAEGVVKCRLIIVAVDGALVKVLPELEGRVWPMRLQMMASGPHPAGLLPHALGTRWGWDYAQQLADTTIAFGGCRDVGGEGERTSDMTPTAGVQHALDLRFRDVTGEVARVTHRWSGTGGYTADGLPIVEEVRPGVWASGGYSGTGNLLGAACARQAARVAMGQGRGADLLA